MLYPRADRSFLAFYEGLDFLIGDPQQKLIEVPSHGEENRPRQPDYVWTLRHKPFCQARKTAFSGSFVVMNAYPPSQTMSASETTVRQGIRR